MNFTVPIEDLDLINKNLEPLLEKMYNSSFFLTGAKGFFGIWIIESLLYLNEKYNLNIKIYALTRSATLFYEKYSHLSLYKELQIIEGDVLNYQRSFEKLDYIIHAANYPYNKQVYWATKHLEHALGGTINITNDAKKYNVKSILFTSSGSVYNNFYSQNTNCFKEEDIVLDASVAQVYSQAKLLSEQILVDFYNNTTIPTTIARCFSFYGKHLPLQGFALGNFIENALKKETIHIRGDGQSRRTYMHVADLVSALLYLLLSNTELETVNIGSDEAISIEELARFIANECDLSFMKHNKEENGVGPKNYIPCIDKLKKKYAHNQKNFLENLASTMRTLKDSV